LVNLVAILLFILSLISAGAVFAYQKVLNTQIVSEQTSFANAEGAFEPDVIEQLARFDSRINNTEDLLQNHVAPSGIFDFLSTMTLQNVQFTDFSYVLANGTATIALDGVADSFSTVALQSDQFGSTRLLKDVVFTNVTVGQTGQVTFSVTATLDPSLYLYVQQASSAQATPNASPTPAATTPNVPTQTP
jgi:hypothetical protein